jgi:hypothetical protein
MADILDDWLDARLQGVHTAIPGEVELYDPTKRLARVKPLVSQLSRFGESLSIPPIDGVPVVFPGSKNAGICWPLEKGDGVLLIFAETGIGDWLNGNADTAADSEARFCLTDAIAIPGLWQIPKIPKPGPTDRLEVSYKKTIFELTGEGFKLTQGGTTLESLPSGGVKITGDLEVSGNISATQEVSAMAITPATAVKLSTHIHPTPSGPSSSPTPGT